MKGSDDKSIGMRIIDIRSITGYRQEDFAKEIYVSRPMISQYENGLRTPSKAVIAHICNQFNVNKDWLLTGKGEIFITTAEATKFETSDPTEKQEQTATPTPTETPEPTETIVPTENKKTFGRGRYQHARICGKAENVEQLNDSIRSTYMGLTNRLLEESDTEYGKVFTAVQGHYLNEMIVNLEQHQQNLMFYIEEQLEQLAAVTQLKESIIEQRKMIGKLSTGNASTDHPFVVPDKLLGKAHPYLQELAGKAFDTPVAK